MANYAFVYLDYCVYFYFNNLVIGIIKIINVTYSKMQSIAVLLTVFNRKEKTLACLSSLFEAAPAENMAVWLTDDGSSDGSAVAIRESFPDKEIHILQGDGNLFWNGGMINSWNAAIEQGGYDGYLWLNNDVVVLPGLWDELVAAEEYSLSTFGKTGIYVGSVKDAADGHFTYGGFNFVSKLSLKDQFVIPDGEFHTCQCAHGNVTFVSSAVVDKMGVFCDEYIHGGTDHDYTYLAYKAGFPLIVLRDYAGLCENDHSGSQRGMDGMNLRERLAYLKSPHGLNLHNTLLFQKRCFPWRLPFAFVAAYLKVIFPNITYKFYRAIRH